MPRRHWRGNPFPLCGGVRAPRPNVTFDGGTFNAYTNTTSANNSNPIWWREDTEGSGANANPIKTFTFVNNKVTGTRPVKIERIGKTVSPFSPSRTIHSISAYRLVMVP